MPGERCQRVDRWLWIARLVKSRTLAADLVRGGHVRINKIKIQRPAHPVGPGDIVTVVHGRVLHLVRVLSPGVRRGPVAEARLLYETLNPKLE